MNPGNAGGGKEPNFWIRTSKDERAGTMGNLAIPPKVQKIQRVLYEKAKSAPDFRFYSLYDKVCDRDMLELAYRKAKLNGGAPGIDGQTFDMIEDSGREAWLDDLARELREKTYIPGAVRRILIPKPNGKMRPLGIPNIKDRVVQVSAVIVLESIFEADMPDEQYAYRHGKRAQDAVKRVQCLMNRDRHLYVVDADLTGYFDNIPHPELIKCLSRRISDGTMMHMLKMWLEAPVAETDPKSGRVTFSTHSRNNRIGTPQGAPISPLFSNLYMREFILTWKKEGHERFFGGQAVNYADDLVICCTRQPKIAMETMTRIMARLKLTVNEEKTRLCYMPRDEFVFLGYVFREEFSFKKKVKYIGTAPADKSIRKITSEIHDLTAGRNGWMETSEMVKRLNWKIRGWAGYFCTGALSKSYRRVYRHVIGRFRNWLKRKYKRNTLSYKWRTDQELYKEYNLVDIFSLMPRYS